MGRLGGTPTTVERDGGAAPAGLGRAGGSFSGIVVEERSVIAIAVSSLVVEEEEEEEAAGLEVGPLVVSSEVVLG